MGFGGFEMFVFWNSYPAYQKTNISNPPNPIAFSNLQIPHTEKIEAKILHTKKSFLKILLSHFYLGPNISSQKMKTTN
jgi:hypothetical protein